MNQTGNNGHFYPRISGLNLLYRIYFVIVIQCKLQEELLCHREEARPAQ
jgi:hypothetical protein